MDPEKRRALTDFYREEFLRHFEFLVSNGILNEDEGKGDGHRHMSRTCRKLISDLDHVCWRAGFPAVAETLLQNFDALTRLSELDPRKRH